MRKVFALLPCLFILGGCNPFANSWVEDCEDAMKFRLKAPSSYKRIDYALTSSPMTLNEYFDSQPNLMPAQREDLLEKKPDIRKWTAFVTYETVNSFNAPIRDKFYCDAVTTTGKEPAGGAEELNKRLFIKVNGKIGLELGL